MRSLQHKGYVNQVLKEDKTILIVPDKSDIDLICSKMLIVLSNLLPYRKFIVSFEQKQSIATFVVSETLSFIDNSGATCYKDVIIQRYYMNAIINFMVDDKTKQYLLHKYDYYMKDYEQDLNDLYDATNIYFQMNVPKQPFEITIIKEKNQVMFSSFEPSNISIGKFLFFKTYTFTYNAHTYIDYIKIKKIINDARKKITIQ